MTPLKASAPARSLVFAATVGACSPSAPGIDFGGTDGGSTAGGGTGGSDPANPSAGADDDAITTSGADGDTVGDASEDDDGAKFDLAPATDAGGDASACPCAPNTEFIHLLGIGLHSSEELWRFDPATLSFVQVADISCEGQIGHLYSMAVSRNGRAYIESTWQTDIFEVDINNGECLDPGYAADMEAPWDWFGMSFASNGRDDPCDRLYTATNTPGSAEAMLCSGCGTLGQIDPPDMAHAEIGPLDFSGGELAGTADGRLFAFAGSSPAKLIELDKETGALLEVTDLPGLELTSTFAFAFWGGDFYFFTEKNNNDPGGPDFPGIVTRLDYDQSGGAGPILEVVVEETPVLAYGADSSTCVPLTPEG